MQNKSGPHKIINHNDNFHNDTCIRQVRLPARGITSQWEKLHKHMVILVTEAIMRLLDNYFLARVFYFWLQKNILISQ